MTPLYRKETKTMMFSETDVEEKRIYNQCAVRGLGKDQDSAYTGFTSKELSETNEEYYWFYGGDGHGFWPAVELFRSFDPATVMAKENSFQYIVQQFEPHQARHRSSGTTYYEAKIYDDRVEVCTCGDSQVAVIIDGAMGHITTPHNLNNPLEQERLKDRIALRDVWTVNSGKVTQMISANKLTLRDSIYVCYGNGEKIAMSQSLGHGNITGVAPERVTIPLISGQTVTVVGGSDGFWDMMNLTGESAEADLTLLANSSAPELVALAENRWKQEWTIYWTDEATQRACVAKQRFQANQYDDVSACVFRKTV